MIHFCSSISQFPMIKLSFLTVWSNDHSPFNSLAPGRCGSNFTSLFFKLISRIDILSTSCETDVRWCHGTPLMISQYWLRSWPDVYTSQVTSHYLGHCWPKSMSPYGITRTQRVLIVYQQEHSGKLNINNDKIYLVESSLSGLTQSKSSIFLPYFRQ